MQFEYNVAWDGCKEDPVDLGWIGTGPDGIWLRTHPLIALYDRPWLWDTWIAFEAGQQEPTHHDWLNLSCFEYTCKQHMWRAAEREKHRWQERQQQQSKSN